MGSAIRTTFRPAGAPDILRKRSNGWPTLLSRVRSHASDRERQEEEEGACRNCLKEWKRLTGRIQGLVKADEVFARHQAIRNS